MIDLNKTEIPFNCPACKFSLKVRLEQVSREETITCKNCKKEIQLKDKDGSTRNGVEGVNRSLRDLEKTIKSMNIKIKL